MTSVCDYRSCKQCGYPHAYHDLDCDTSEEEVSCGRCGYCAASERHEENGEVTWMYPEKPGFGVLYYFGGERSFVHQPLHNEEEVQKSDAWLREKLASGEIEAESAYLTRWNPTTRTVELVIGHAHDDTPPPSDQTHEPTKDYAGLIRDESGEDQETCPTCGEQPHICALCDEPYCACTESEWAVHDGITYCSAKCAGKAAEHD